MKMQAFREKDARKCVGTEGRTDENRAGKGASRGNREAKL